jgi:hypothetical protein
MLLPFLFYGVTPTMRSWNQVVEFLSEWDALGRFSTIRRLRARDFGARVDGETSQRQENTHERRGDPHRDSSIRDGKTQEEQRAAQPHQV